MKKKTIVKMMIGILFLLTLIISSTYAYFNIVSTTNNNTTSNYNAKLEDIEKYGTSLLTGGEGELHLRVKASDMTPSKIGNKYYATTSEDDYQLRRGNHVVSKATIQKGLSNYEYNCTSKLTITLDGTMVSEDGLQVGDAKLYLRGTNNNIKNEEYDLKTLIDELELNSEGKKEYTREIEYLLTSDNEGKVMIDVEFANNSNNQTTSSGKNLNIEITNSELVCGLGNDKVYASLANNTNIYGYGSKYRNEEYRDKIVTVSFVKSKPSEEELKTKPMYWDLTDTSKSEEGSVIGWLEEREEDDTYDLYIGSDKEIYAIDLQNTFSHMSNLQSINFNNINTSETIDMSFMFANCSNLAVLDLSNFDTSQVTDMSGMFSYLVSITSIDQIKGFKDLDTTKVTTMNSMFSGCSNLIELDISHFNTSSVTNMSNMFYECRNLTSLDLSSFDTSKVTNMSNMFSNCNNLTNIDVSNFNTSSVTNMSNMFYECRNLIELDLSNFDTSQVENMSQMFYMLFTSNKLENLNLNEWNTSKVTNMYGMFGGCSKLAKLDLSSFDTSNVTNMSSMFYNCSGLNTLDLSNFDTTSVVYMNNMFRNCTNLIDLDISNFDTTSVKNMSGMFSNLGSITSTKQIKGFEKLNTTQVTDMSSMFYNCTSLKELKLNKATFDKVTSYFSMFTSVKNDIHLTIQKGQETFINDRLNDIFPEGHNAKIDLVD